MISKSIILCTFIISQASSPGAYLSPKQADIVNDLPMKDNLLEYMANLEMILDFIEKRKNIVDVNFGFGLFITGLNLKTVLASKGDYIPESLNIIFDRLLKKHGDAVTYFSTQVVKSDQKALTVSPTRRFLELYNEQMWSHHIQGFNLNLINMTTFYTPQELTTIYSPWNMYIANVGADQEALLHIQCVNQLSGLPARTLAHRRAILPTCNLTKDCLERGYTGSDYGHAIIYRVLLLITVRFARDCTLVSEYEDKQIADMLCAKIYNEMEYISQHNFETIDLVFAQITLCSLEGHAQFVRRSWLEKILSYQRKPGCFPETSKSANAPVRTARLQWQLSQPDQEIMGGFCNARSTGFASSAIASAIRVSYQNVNPSPKAEIIKDLPMKHHLEGYMRKLETILDFVQKRKNIVDVNSGFGLFLTGVNLKSALVSKGHRLPSGLEVGFNRILKKHGDSVAYFASQVKKIDKAAKKASTTRHFLDLYNEEMWSRHIQAFNLNLINATAFYSELQLEAIYSTWPTYSANMHTSSEVQLHITCINALSQLPVLNTRSTNLATCKLSSECLEKGYTGSDYGHAMLYRVLLLILVRFSRGCSLVSEVEDKQMVDRLCAKIYNELEYTSHHQFETIDLIVAQISLCTLEGHAQFVRRSWIDKVLSYQRKPGCFPENSHSVKAPLRTSSVQWQLEQPDQEIMGGFCNARTTGFASSAIAATIRYILETQF